jgi:DNA polymerase III subunit epsilon
VRPSRLDRKLVLGVLTLFLAPTVLAGGILLALYHRGLLETPTALLTAVLIGLVTMMTYLGLTTRAIGRSLVRTIQEIQLGAELMAGANPAHRLAVGSGDELQALAEEINRLADRASEAHTGLEREIARATRELTLERNTLSGVLAALGEGVVVAASDGRVTLANEAAQRLLGVPGPPLLGRRLWEFVDRAKLEHFVEQGHRMGGAPQQFTLHGGGEALVATVLTPLTDAARRPVGLILVLRDVTDPIRLDDARRERLAADLLALRGRLAAVRSLSESLLQEPTAADESARRLLEALHAEALRLSDLVTGMAEPARLGLAQAPGHYERLALGDLITMTLRRLEPEEAAGLAVLTDGDAGDPHYLRAEASTLSGGLARLLRTVLAQRAPDGGAWLQARRRGRTLTVDVGAEGEARQADLDAVCEAGALLGISGASRVREVVRQHAGELWAYAEGGRFGFRMTLPEEMGTPEPPRSGGTGARPRAGFVGAGLASGLAEGVPADERPDFYDFSLFEEMERWIGPLDRERPLHEMTYVVLDTETTGLDPDRDRIVSIAGVVVRGRTVRRGEVFDALVNPRRAIPVMSTRFHGITDVAVADCPSVDVVLPAFLDFAAGAVLVGHHVWFDLHILRREAAPLGLEPMLLAHPVLDTVALSHVVHGILPDHGLETVATRLGVVVRGRHSALGDALATAEVLVRLLPLIEKRGVRTLGQALAAARRPRSVRPSSEPKGPVGA